MGNGKKKFIAFHGFGQDGNVFLPLLSNNNDVTIYSFDLPYHGNTIIHDPFIAITYEDIQDVVQQLMKRTSIDKFSLLGFSIGAKLLFPILTKFQTNINEVWLLAPDGIKKNFWYGVATESHPGRFLFRLILNYPTVLKRAGHLLQSIGLVDQKTLLFAIKSIDTQKKRDQVYHTWTYLRKLKFNLNVLVGILNAEKIPVYFVIGTADQVIDKSSITLFHQKLINSTVIELSSGHQNLVNRFADWYSKHSV